eukprot:493326-Pelagomonas_calceolata.AAC.1
MQLSVDVVCFTLELEVIHSKTVSADFLVQGYHTGTSCDGSDTGYSLVCSEVNRRASATIIHLHVGPRRAVDTEDVSIFMKTRGPVPDVIDFHVLWQHL